jgi:hypothetical protein
MNPSRLSKALLLAAGLSLFAIPSVSVAQPGWGQELVNRPYWTGYYGGRGGTNYDREVNGSDASTPGHN